MAAATVTSSVRLALIQLAVSSNKAQNLINARKLVKEAAENKAQIVCLPECFNSPYGIQYFSAYAEQIPGESSTTLAELAKELSIYLIGGSIPESDNGKLFNTCMVYGPEGEQIAKHRKVHLFDINVPGGIKFTESAALTPGNSLSMFHAGPWKIGVGICYDVRFGEMSAEYDRQGCHLLVYPGAFNMTTGPAHWELLLRARALDHQLYVAGCSPARDESASYIAWGHSTICSPWADVMAKADHSESILYADLELSRIEQVRTAIPTRAQRRPDVYRSFFS